MGIQAPVLVDNDHSGKFAGPFRPEQIPDLSARIYFVAPIIAGEIDLPLLKLLAQHAGKPLSRESIIQRIWGYNFEGETDPVKVYVNFLRRKLNAEGEADLIYSVRGFGYSLQETPCE